MFASMAGSAIGESGIQAMFFSRFGTDTLPLMYLAQAVTTLIAMFALTAVLDRLAHRLIYIVSPALLVAILLVERAVVLTDAGWIYPVLWVTVAFATLAQAIGLWGVAGSVVDTRQAKRLFPIFGAGGILGSVAGGLLTRPLAAALGAPNLLFVWAAALAVAGLLTRIVLGPVPPPLAGTRRHRSSALGDLRRGLGIVRRSRLLMAMAVSAVLFSVLFYSLFLPFASAAAARYPDAGELAGFLGLVWAVVTGTAFVASILLTNRLFVWFGVAAMVLVLPLLYTGAFAVLIVTTAFSAIVSLRIVTGVWLQGVASPAWETLVNIVPAERRDQTRAFLNGGPAQVGTAIAGIVALVGQDVLTAGVRGDRPGRLVAHARRGPRDPPLVHGRPGRGDADRQTPGVRHGRRVDADATGARRRGQARADGLDALGRSSPATAGVPAGGPGRERRSGGDTARGR